MAGKSPEKLLKEQRKDKREWLQLNGQYILERSACKLRKNLDEGSEIATRIIGSPISGIALFHGARGCLKVLDGEEDGWQDIDLALRFNYWRVKIAAGVTFKALAQGPPPDPLRLYLQVTAATSLFFYAVVQDIASWRTELWELHQRIVLSPDALRSGHWSAEIPYTPFSIKCCLGGPLTEEFELPKSLEEMPLGPYENLYNHWRESDEQVKAYFEEACDFHCQQMASSSPHQPIAVFSDSPFDFIPVEILALLKLRKLQGLSVPELRHPLLDLPTASLASSDVMTGKEPVFLQLEEFYNRHFVYPN
jgi:hypothetical protein